MSNDYFSGTVESYVFSSGFGIIVPDEPDREGERLVLLRAALRDKTVKLVPGARVRFAKTFAPSGALASDVHELEGQQTALFDVPESGYGRIRTWLHPRGFGFIKTDAGQELYVHRSSLLDRRYTPQPGHVVAFDIAYTSKGLKAQNVRLREESSPRGASSLKSSNPPAYSGQASQRTGAFDYGSLSSTHDVQLDPTTVARSLDLLAKAILARDERDYDKATALYHQGMTECPTVQLVLSYAAMQKNRNRKAEAMKVYEAGVRAFPNNAKLWEDAGTLAASIQDYSRSIKMMERALSLYKGQAKMQALLWLGRAHYHRDGLDDLKKAIEYFELVDKTFENSGSGSRLPASDALLVDLAKFRTRHHRGALTYRFLVESGCIIKSVDFEAASSADLIVEFRNRELKESYGLTTDILVRCIFQANVTRRDLDTFDERIRAYGEAGIIDEQIALLVVASLNSELQSVLSNRIEDRKRAQPAIVPIGQAEAETSPDAANLLRDVFNRWLFRRDLFSINSPVVGRRFFGRDKQLAQLRDAISNGTSSGIFGLRKVGKTSLLKETARRAQASGDVVVFLDLLSIPADIVDARWIYWKIASQLSEQSGRLGLRLTWRLGQGFPDFLDVPTTFPIATAFDADLSNLLKLLRLTEATPRPKVILLLDEIERLLPTDSGDFGVHGFFDFLGYLRGIAQESSDFVVFVTGANAAVAEIGQFNFRDNPVFNFFSEIYLPLLEIDECTLMIRSLGRGMGLTFTIGALSAVHRLTGGHPFFTRQLCSFVAERYRERPNRISEEAVDAIIDSYIEFCAKDFVEITQRLTRDYPEELNILIRLSENGGTGSLDQFKSTRDQSVPSLKHLLGYQLIRLSESEVSLTMELMNIWLRRSMVSETV